MTLMVLKIILNEIYVGSGSNKVHAGGGNDLIYLNSGQNFIWGENGDDIIYSGSGKDFINGGDGIDIVDFSMEVMEICL